MNKTLTTPTDTYKLTIHEASFIASLINDYMKKFEDALLISGNTSVGDLYFKMVSRGTE